MCSHFSQHVRLPLSFSSIRYSKSQAEGDSGGKKEGTSQRTCMNDPWTWTTGWGLTVGAGRGGQREKNWDKYNRITIKND